MIKALLFDLARVILFPKDELYKGELNKLHAELSKGISYNFSDRFALDPEMISYIQTLQTKLDVYMFTSGTIQNAPEIKPILEKLFKKIYSASDMGIPKDYPLAYKEILKDLELAANEIVFIDDSIQNVEAAKEAGINAIQFKGLDTLKKELDQY